MVIAIDILSDTFHKTKKLFFPVKAGYWLRMGFASLLNQSSYSGGSFNFNGSGGTDFPSSMSIKEQISVFNSKALSFLSQYGFLVGLLFILLASFSVIFTYITSIFTFVFIDGLMQKKFLIKKSYVKNHMQGISLFWTRILLGVLMLICLIINLLPLLISFFSGTLASFNLFYLIPMIILFVIVMIFFSIIFFFISNFIVPLMYLKKTNLRNATSIFYRLLHKNILEILLYWLVKIGLAVTSFLIIIPIFILYFLFALIFILFGVGLFFLGNIVGTTLAIFLTILYGLPVGLLLFYGFVVLTVPIPSFFRMYSIKMVQGIEKKR